MGADCAKVGMLGILAEGFDGVEDLLLELLTFLLLSLGLFCPDLPYLLLECGNLRVHFPLRLGNKLQIYAVLLTDLRDGLRFGLWVSGTKNVGGVEDVCDCSGDGPTGCADDRLVGSDDLAHLLTEVALFVVLGEAAMDVGLTLENLCPDFRV